MNKFLVVSLAVFLQAVQVQAATESKCGCTEPEVLRPASAAATLLRDVEVLTPVERLGALVAIRSAIEGGIRIENIPSVMRDGATSEPATRAISTVVKAFLRFAASMGIRAEDAVLDAAARANITVKPTGAAAASPDEGASAGGRPSGRGAGAGASAAATARSDESAYAALVAQVRETEEKLATILGEANTAYGLMGAPKDVEGLLAAIAAVKLTPAQEAQRDALIACHGEAVSARAALAAYRAPVGASAAPRATAPRTGSFGDNLRRGLASSARVASHVDAGADAPAGSDVPFDRTPAPLGGGLDQEMRDAIPVQVASREDVAALIDPELMGQILRVVREGQAQVTTRTENFTVNDRRGKEPVPGNVLPRGTGVDAFVRVAPGLPSLPADRKGAGVGAKAAAASDDSGDDITFNVLAGGSGKPGKPSGKSGKKVGE